MNVLINAENIYLSEQTKGRIQEMLIKLEEVLPDDANIRLFLKHDARSDVRAVLTVRDRHHNFAYSVHGDRVLRLVRSARAHVLRCLREQKQKRIHLRKRRKLAPIAA